MKRAFNKLLVAFALLIAGISSSPDLHAADLSGLKVGEKAPGFSLPNQEGATVQLGDSLKKGPVALVFFRSADW